MAVEEVTVAIGADTSGLRREIERLEEFAERVAEACGAYLDDKTTPELRRYDRVHIKPTAYDCEGVIVRPSSLGGWTVRYLDDTGLVKERSFYDFELEFRSAAPV